MDGRHTTSVSGATSIEQPGMEAPSNVLVIGASTGGPQALETVLGGMGAALEHIAVLVVLHMPSEFAEIVAQHVARLTGRPTCIAAHDDPIEKGHIYISPGDVHLEVTRQAAVLRLAHSRAAPENSCRPSVDVLFRSAAGTFGADTLALILSGMGHDGLSGAGAIVKAGGCVFVQDEATSVVWGMPGAVAAAGLASAVLPVHMIAPRVRRLLNQRALSERPA